LYGSQTAGGRISGTNFIASGYNIFSGTFADSRRGDPANSCDPIPSGFRKNTPRLK
jgi:hypothetical protein